MSEVGRYSRQVNMVGGIGVVRDLWAFLTPRYSW